jgi:hypothetical protein
VARSIAVAVAETTRREGLADATPAEDAARRVDSRMWLPRYLPMMRRRA